MTTKFLVGTVEYLDVTVTAQVTITAQAVSISIDGGTTWNTAAWTSGTGTTTAVASILLGTTIPMPPVGIHNVRVKVTNSPEIPIIDAGAFYVEP